VKLGYQVSTPEVYRAPGVTSYQDDFEKSVRALRDRGYDGVELMVRDPRQVDTAELSRVLEKYGYEVPMICTGEVYGQDKLSFADPQDEVRNEAVGRIKAAVDIAALFGKQINLGRARGGYLPGVPLEKTYARIFEAVLEVTDYAAKKDVLIALEPVNTLGLNFINTTLEGLEFVKKVGSPYFRLMIDTAHMHIEDRDIEDSVRKSRDYITFVHLADSNRRYPGAGKFDFPAFIRLLKTVGYDGWVSVEVFPMPDQETALKKSYENIRPLL
jgi:sugar phosphate isomerase/epimerase